MNANEPEPSHNICMGGNKTRLDAAFNFLVPLLYTLSTFLFFFKFYLYTFFFTYIYHVRVGCVASVRQYQLPRLLSMTIVSDIFAYKTTI
jgi:hypothetical protein